MRRSTLLLIPLVLLLLVSRVQAQEGDGFDLTWWTVDGGGTRHEGGGYILLGTAGQPDPGPALTGGGFTLVGGFWPGVLTLRYPVYLPLVLRQGP